MQQETKDWIDNASYRELLTRWRRGCCGDPTFQGAAGDYFRDVMFRKRDALSHEDQVKTSKLVGWG